MTWIKMIKSTHDDKTVQRSRNEAKHSSDDSAATESVTEMKVKIMQLNNACELC